MSHDGEQPKEKDEGIQLQCLDAHTGGPSGGKRFYIEYSKPKHTRHGTVGHEEGEISSGEEEVDEERCGEEAGPHDDVFVEGLECHGFFAALFAVVGLVDDIDKIIDG